MLGERLKALRAAHGLMQYELAIAAGIERTKVCKLETGALKGRNLGDLRALARGFGMGFDLFDRYLSGEIELVDVMSRAKAPRKKAA